MLPDRLKWNQKYETDLLRDTPSSVVSRRLFPYIREGLNRGGILIFQTFLDSPNGGKEPHHCRDYRLRENELLHAFLSLKILFYKEGKERSYDDAIHLATLVAVRMG